MSPWSPEVKESSQEKKSDPGCINLVFYSNNHIKTYPQFQVRGKAVVSRLILELRCFSQDGTEDRHSDAEAIMNLFIVNSPEIPVDLR